MSILINKDTRVITQGMTGKVGQFHTFHCKQYANGADCFVAGVNPKKAGENFEGIPVYASVREAKQATGATVSVIYVPPAGAAAKPPIFGPWAANRRDESAAGPSFVVSHTPYPSRPGQTISDRGIDHF